MLEMLSETLFDAALSVFCCLSLCFLCFYFGKNIDKERQQSF